jgi:hypothetical protein
VETVGDQQPGCLASSLWGTEREVCTVLYMYVIPWTFVLFDPQVFLHQIALGSLATKQDMTLEILVFITTIFFSFFLYTLFTY